MTAHVIVFGVIAGGLAALAFAFWLETPRGQHTPRAIERRNTDSTDDRRTLAWLRSLHEAPARVMASPLTAARVRVAVLRAAIDRARGTIEPPETDDEYIASVAHLLPPGACATPAVPWADIDQYLTSDAMRHDTDIVLAAPMTGRPAEPPLEPLPPARAVPDVRPRILNWHGELTGEEVEELKQRFLAAVGKPAVLAAVMCPEGCGCRVDTDDADRRECGCDGACGGDDESWGEEHDVPLLPPKPPDVTDLDDTSVMAALTDWALHAPLDQIQAATR